jgi:hypothetical protein
VANVYGLLNPKGMYLSLCLNERDPAFGGAGKYRRTPLDTLLYFSSLGELGALFDPCFTILDLRTVEAQSKSVSHLTSYCFMERRVTRRRK